MPRNKVISTIQTTKFRTVEIPFFVILETNQQLCSAGVENTDMPSVGRGYSITVPRLSAVSQVAAERCHSGNSQSCHLLSTELFLQLFREVRQTIPLVEFIDSNKTVIEFFRPKFIECKE